MNEQAVGTPPPDGIRSALVVSWVSIVWGAMSGTAALGFGLDTGSVALAGSGLCVLVDLMSSAVLVWRFRHPAGHGTVERRAHLVAASALSMLGVGLAVAAIERLAVGAEARASVGGIVTAAASLAVLPVLVVRKYRIATVVQSRALRADGYISAVGAANALVTLTGLALTRAGVHNADSVAGLVIAAAALTVGVYELVAVRRL